MYFGTYVIKIFDYKIIDIISRFMDFIFKVEEIGSESMFGKYQIIQFSFYSSLAPKRKNMNENEGWQMKSALFIKVLISNK